MLGLETNHTGGQIPVPSEPELFVTKDATVMVTTDLGACEWFVWDLRRSNLLDRGQLDQVVGEYLQKVPRAEPQALAEYLVGQGILTQFQADRLLQGKTQGFVLGPYTLMDSVGAGGMHYLAWPLVEGETLEQVVGRQGKLAPDQAALFALQVAEGLEACQKEKLIHGLIKPSNLMVGADRQMRILDYGIGCLLAET